MMKTGGGSKHVVEGACVRCTKGTSPTTLKATKNTRIGTQLVITETDTAPSCFAGTFGTCAKTKKPCAMKNLPTWMNTTSTFLADGSPVVTEDSFLVCVAGAGAILPVDSGQQCAADDFTRMMQECYGFTPEESALIKLAYDKFMSYHSTKNHQLKSKLKNFFRTCLHYAQTMMVMQ